MIGEKMNKIKLTMNELFSGIGAQKRGIVLTELYDCEVISTSDIDKDAMLSYAAIHKGLTKELINTYDKYPTKEEMAKLLIARNIGYDFKKNKPYDWNKHIKQKNRILETYYLACALTDNLGDISLIRELPYADFWTYSFPCQDISVAGKQAGIKEGTRSGLLKEVERLLDIAVTNNNSPKFLLLENVKNLIGKQNKPDFDAWLNKLDELGYNTYWQVVNGKFCGIPQNRERTFAISIRKDIDTGLFKFMKPFDNGLRLRDLLDETVDEKYYISEDKLERFITELNSNDALMYDSCQIKREGKSREYNDYSPTLNSRDYKDPRLVNETVLTPIDKSYNNPKSIEIANCITAREDRCISNRKKEGTAVLENTITQVVDFNKPIRKYEVGSGGQGERIYDEDGISVALSCNHNGRDVLLEDKIAIENISDKFKFAKDKCMDFYNKNGYLPEMLNPYNQAEIIDYAPTQTTSCDRSCSSATVLLKDNKRRIRKLTPTECFRLMGFTDNDIELITNIGIADSQQYKQAGNSIITFCIKLIMEHLYKALYNNTYICTDEKVLNGEIEEINFTQPQAV
jgi:DNA (cytosine-5)-methyltransferase 1